MQQYAAALGVAEEAIAKPGAPMRTLDQAGQIGEDEFTSIHFDDAELRMQCRERVVGNLWFGRTDRSQECRFTGIGQAYESGVGNQLEAQPDSLFFSRLPGVGMAWCPVSRRFEMRVAETPITAFGNRHPLSNFGEVGE